MASLWANFKSTVTGFAGLFSPSQSQSQSQPSPTQSQPAADASAAFDPFGAQGAAPLSPRSERRRRAAAEDAAQFAIAATPTLSAKQRLKAAATGGGGGGGRASSSSAAARSSVFAGSWMADQQSVDRATNKRSHSPPPPDTNDAARIASNKRKPAPTAAANGGPNGSTKRVRATSGGQTAVLKADAATDMESDAKNLARQTADQRKKKTRGLTRLDDVEVIDPPVAAAAAAADDDDFEDQTNLAIALNASLQTPQPPARAGAAPHKRTPQPARDVQPELQIIHDADDDGGDAANPAIASNGDGDSDDDDAATIVEPDAAPDTPNAAAAAGGDDEPEVVFRKPKKPPPAVAVAPTPPASPKQRKRTVATRPNPNGAATTAAAATDAKRTTRSAAASSAAAATPRKAPLALTPALWSNPRKPSNATTAANPDAWLPADYKDPNPLPRESPPPTPIADSRGFKLAAKARTQQSKLSLKTSSSASTVVSFYDTSDTTSSASSSAAGARTRSGASIAASPAGRNANAPISLIDDDDDEAASATADGSVGDGLTENELTDKPASFKLTSYTLNKDKPVSNAVFTFDVEEIRVTHADDSAPHRWSLAELSKFGLNSQVAPHFVAMRLKALVSGTDTRFIGWVKDAKELRAAQKIIFPRIQNAKISFDMLDRSDAVMKFDKLLHAEVMKARAKAGASGGPTEEPYLVYPPGGGADTVSIHESDLLLLGPSEWLNDVIIDFGVYYMRENLEPTKRDKFHLFNSYFWKRYITTAGGAEKKYESVKKWTKTKKSAATAATVTAPDSGAATASASSSSSSAAAAAAASSGATSVLLDIFTKDYLFVPINDRLHWTFAVICYPGVDPNANATDSATGEGAGFTSMNRTRKTTIIYFDSLGEGVDAPPKTIAALRSYLQHAWNDKDTTARGEERPTRRFDKNTVPCVTAKTPQQQNGSDCGVFVLHQIDMFLKRPESYFDRIVKAQTAIDFSLVDISRRRSKLKQNIMYLHAHPTDRRAENDQIEPAPPRASQSQSQARSQSASQSQSQSQSEYVPSKRYPNAVSCGADGKPVPGAAKFYETKSEFDFPGTAAATAASVAAAAAARTAQSKPASKPAKASAARELSIDDMDASVDPAAAAIAAPAPAARAAAAATMDDGSDDEEETKGVASAAPAAGSLPKSSVVPPPNYPPAPQAVPVTPSNPAVASEGMSDAAPSAAAPAPTGAPTPVFGKRSSSTDTASTTNGDDDESPKPKPQPKVPASGDDGDADFEDQPQPSSAQPAIGGSKPPASAPATATAAAAASDTSSSATASTSPYDSESIGHAETAARKKAAKAVSPALPVPAPAPTAAAAASNPPSAIVGGGLRTIRRVGQELLADSIAKTTGATPPPAVLASASASALAAKPIRKPATASPSRLRAVGSDVEDDATSASSDSSGKRAAVATVNEVFGAAATATASAATPRVTRSSAHLQPPQPAPQAGKKSAAKKSATKPIDPDGDDADADSNAKAEIDSSQPEADARVHAAAASSGSSAGSFSQSADTVPAASAATAAAAPVAAYPRKGGIPEQTRTHNYVLNPLGPPTHVIPASASAQASALRRAAAEKADSSTPPAAASRARGTNAASVRLAAVAASVNAEGATASSDAAYQKKPSAAGGATPSLGGSGSHAAQQLITRYSPPKPPPAGAATSAVAAALAAAASPAGKAHRSKPGPRSREHALPLKPVTSPAAAAAAAAPPTVASGVRSGRKRAAAVEAAAVIARSTPIDVEAEPDNDE